MKPLKSSRGMRNLALGASVCALMLMAGCEGAINPTKKTNEGLNTLSFWMNGETISSGGRAPDWVVSIFSIFNPNPEERNAEHQSVFSGYNAARDTFSIYAALTTLNSWDATQLSIQFPARLIKQGATLDFRDIKPAMAYHSGYERDASFPEGYAFTPIQRNAEFLDGSLHIRSWDPDACILSGEFSFTVRLILEGIANDTFHAGSGKNAQHPDTYEVRPREIVELTLTRGTFDVKYTEQ